MSNKTRIIPMVFLMLVGSLAGANAQGFHFWFDDDYAERRASDAAALSLDISTLPPGLHTFNVMSGYDDGTTSFFSKIFYKNEIQLKDQGYGYEFWFDDGYAERRTSDAAAMDLDISALAPGLHTFNVMGNNYHGATQFFSKVFYKKDVEIVELESGYEYWFDDNYADRQSSKAEVLSLDISALQEGLHTFNVSYECRDGRFGSFREIFYKRDKVQQGDGSYEYWFDEDYEGRKVSKEEMLSLDISQLETGPHYLHTHALNYDGTHTYNCNMFFVHRIEQQILDICEYWVDDDYETTRQVAKAVDGQITFAMDMSKLTNGEHWLKYTIRNTEGTWSQEDSLKFNKIELIPLDDLEWNAVLALREALIERGWTEPWVISENRLEAYLYKGLQIEDGHIEKISIPNLNLSGTMPLELLAFPYLKILNISGNNFTGDMPAMLSGATFKSLGLKELNVSKNRFSGNVGVLANCFTELTSLNASYNAFGEVSPMVSKNVTDLKIGNQTVDKVVAMNMSSIDAADFIASIPSILLYDHANQKYNTSANLLMTTAESEAFDQFTNEEWAMRMEFNDGWHTGPYVYYGNNVYRGENGRSVNALCLDDSGQANGNSFKVAISFDSGDANFVDGVNASDLQATILYAFGNYGNNLFNFTAADTYADGTINVQDVVCTVNVLLNQNASAQTSPAKVKGDNAAADAYLYIKGGQVILRTETPIAAASIKAAGDIEWNADKLGMQQTAANGNVVVYSLTGATLPAGETVIGICTGNATLCDATMADAEARAVSVAIGEGGATGIDAIEAAADGDVRIYDATGARRNRLGDGVNIINANGGNIKVVRNKNK